MSFGCGPGSRGPGYSVKEGVGNPKISTGLRSRETSLRYRGLCPKKGPRDGNYGLRIDFLFVRMLSGCLRPQGFYKNLS